MKKVTVLLILLNFILVTNLWAISSFREESNFYLDSKGVNIFEVEDEGLKDLKDTLKKYDGMYGIQFSQLMSEYNYELVREEKAYEGNRFLIKFHLDEKELPDFITVNDNFLWEKLYKDTTIALNISGNFTYAFDKEELVISNSINLLFETEELNFIKDSKKIEDKVEYKRYFTDENYKYAYMTDYESANFYYENQYIIKEIKPEKVITQGFYNLETEGVILSEAKKISYKTSLDSMKEEIEEIFPEFEPLELPSLKGVRYILKVEGLDYDYLVIKTTDMGTAKKSIIKDISNYIFLKDKELPLVESEGRTYLEVPLLYRKIYIENYGESTIIFTNEKNVLEKLATNEKIKGLKIENDKNFIIDFGKGFKELQYYDDNMFIKVKERI